VSTDRASPRKLRALGNISWLTARQLNQLSKALTVSTIEKRSTIFDENALSGSAYILLSGVARITCRNRRGQRTLVIVLAPGLIPSLPPVTPGIRYDFRCEAVTLCRIGTIELETFVEISLGVGSAEFKQMEASYLGRWDLVQLRCANFMSCSMEERLALTLLELSVTFGVPDPNGVRLALSTRHRDLAELVGASRPRITEQLIKFERRHLISRNTRQLVVNRDRLEAFLARTH
jgi:CRP/FNR family transcriptional regulator, cyclic AMP receptor protein